MLVRSWGEAKQPRQAEREQIAALRGDQRMQLVEDDALERAEQIRRVSGGEQQRQLLRRGEQDLRRVAALALALRGRRVAGARLDADRQAHLGDRRFQVARDIDGERLERRDVERVQAALAAHVAAGRDEFSFFAARSRRTSGAAQLHQARQKSGQRLAAAGRRDQQDRTAGLCFAQKFELMGARRPAAAGEPACENVREDCGPLKNAHQAEVTAACGAVEACATTTRLSTGTPFSLRTETSERDARASPASLSARRMCGSPWA